VDSLPADSLLARLFFDARRARVIVLPTSGAVGSPTLAAGAAVTRVSFPADRPDAAVVVARSRAHFRLRFGGLFTGAVPDSLPAGGLLRALRPIAAAGGSAFECEIAHEAAGFRLGPDASGRRVVLELFRESVPGTEPFAPEGPRGPRVLRTIVLDPGHGGDDPGVIAGGAVEKDLALALARVLRTELEHRLAARVVLTRDDDRNLSADQRAEVANRARADVVIALHFDGLPASGARGATAYCPPATFTEAGDGEASPGGSQPFQLLPWRDVAVRQAVQSRSLAEAVLSALELRGEGPTRLRDRLPCALLGVNAPGLLLECAVLTSPADRERVQQAQGLQELAATIAEGVLAWQRNE
jgi:N-acetylmuramoyl-L-alanine amidase